MENNQMAGEKSTAPEEKRKSRQTKDGLRFPMYNPSLPLNPSPYIHSVIHSRIHSVAWKCRFACVSLYISALGHRAYT